MPKETSELTKIRSALASAGQASLFGDPEADLKLACSEYLSSKGYKVVHPRYKTRVKSVEGLVDYFYDMYSRSLDRSGEWVPVYRNNRMQDLGTAKRFVESRMEASGIDKETAIKECAEIIKTVVENFDEFGFKKALSFSIFGQDKCAWITQKAMGILNSSEAALKEAVDYCDRVTASIEDRYPHGFEDLDELIKQTEEN